MLGRGASLGEIGQLLRLKQPTPRISTPRSIARRCAHCPSLVGSASCARCETALDDYLGARRALGHKLILTGRLLRRFVDFAEHAHADYITTELALKWATQPAHAQPSQWANRLGMVRRFARYCYANDPRTTMPPPDLLPHRYRRVAPYIYSDEQIIRLLKAARRLPSTSLRPQPYTTLFGLYVATVCEPTRHCVFAVRTGPA